jgi:hypothetical protein
LGVERHRIRNRRHRDASILTSARRARAPCPDG